MKNNDYQQFDSLTQNPLFAILDIETTGFSPKTGDKILEIAIITTDLSGNVVDEYETLINPQRAVTAGHIHGITAGMVMDAPKIQEVLDDIAFHLNGKTIVGHNIDFDLRFINHELSMYYANETRLPGVCTLKLSRKLLPSIPVRTLESFCQYFDIPAPEIHSAACDGHATLTLFHTFREMMLERMPLEQFLEEIHHPVITPVKNPPAGIRYKRSDAGCRAETEQNRLNRLISRLPSNPSDPVPVIQYLNILDDIMADRKVTEAEVRQLSGLIDEFHISRDQAINIHREYLRKLVRVYWLDRHLSDAEINDLKVVASLLGVDESGLSAIIDQVTSAAESRPESRHSAGRENLEGKCICFTGELRSRLNGVAVERAQAQQLAMERGMIIKSGVSRNLDYLVTADADSLSGKARKAREMGIRIVAEPVFWNMIGVAVE